MRFQKGDVLRYTGDQYPPGIIGVVAQVTNCYTHYGTHCDESECDYEYDVTSIYGGYGGESAIINTYSFDRRPSNLGRRGDWESVAPRLGDRVRCAGIFCVGRFHGMTRQCQDPVFSMQTTTEINDFLLSSNESIDELRDGIARIRRSQEIIRTLDIRVGQTRYIDMYDGSRTVATIMMNTPFGRILVRPRDRQVGHERYVMADQVGDLVPAWVVPAIPPRDICMPEGVSYAARVTVGDVQIREIDSSHECDSDCMDLGCRNYDTDIDDHYRDDDDDNQCSCGDCNDDGDYGNGARVYGYNYRPRLLFLGDGPVYLGSELEISSGGDGARRAQMARTIHHSMGNYVYMKEDSSISGGGIEMVTHPMSYDWLISNWDLDLFPSLRRIGADPHTSCGMHVHVSRAGFQSASHAYKWIKFFYRNQKIITRVARRSSDRWASFQNQTHRENAKWFAKGGYGSERYVAVNCMNANTYEVRLFASTLNNQKFLGSVGLVDASVQFMAHTSSHDILTKGAWEFAAFKDFVTSFDKYKPLSREFVRLGV